MTWLGVVDTLTIIAILWALWRVVDRIEALERGTGAMRREVDDLRIEECRRFNDTLRSR